MNLPSSSPDLPIRPFRLVLLLGGGALLFALGLAAARTRLPEWRGATPERGAMFAEHLLEELPRAGFQVAPGAVPAITLTSRAEAPGENPVDCGSAYSRFGNGRAADWLAEKGRGPYIEVRLQASAPGTQGKPVEGILRAVFSRTGTPLDGSWTPRDALGAGTAAGDTTEIGRRLGALIAEAPVAGEVRLIDRFGTQFGVRAVPTAADPPETVYWTGLGTNGVILCHRSLATVDEVVGRLERVSVLDLVRPELSKLASQILLICVVGGSLFLLLHRRRLGLVNGLLLGALALVVALPALPKGAESTLDLVSRLVMALVGAGSLALLWAVAESWVRFSVPGFTTSLDTLRAGRLGPRAGTALLAGSAAGAAFAGLILAAAAGAVTVEGAQPGGASVALPLFEIDRGPLHAGLLWAGTTILALGLLGRILPRQAAGRLGVVAAALLAAFVLAPFVPVRPWGFGLGVAFVLSLVLLSTYRRFGLAALWVAATVGFLLPALAFSLHFRPWTSGSIPGLAVLVLAPALVGGVGLRRSERGERILGAAPAFVRRLEQEHRLRHEMELLTRMQLGLLPAAPPTVPGWRLAARSLLASEAGGDLYDFVDDESGALWVAAGDVAGHGYSCAITQAMTKAGLVSLIEPGRGPGEVLDRLDRVLRRSGGTGPRAFTSLCLLRLDPRTGEGRMANAGHPFPFLLGADRQVRELALPGLPLGQGPVRRREEIGVAVPPGGALLIASDGYYEGVDTDEDAYGFERAREILSVEAWRLDPEALLEALLVDWRRHVGDHAPADDTTLLVLRRELETDQAN